MRLVASYKWMKRISVVSPKARFGKIEVVVVQKTPVFGLLTRDRVFALTVPDVSANTLHTVINWVVKRHSTVVTDGFVSYNGLSKNYRHEIVEHNNGSYKNKRGFHTNGIEGFW